MKSCIVVASVLMLAACDLAAPPEIDLPQNQPWAVVHSDDYCLANARWIRRDENRVLAWFSKSRNDSDVPVAAIAVDLVSRDLLLAVKQEPGLACDFSAISLAKPSDLQIEVQPASILADSSPLEACDVKLRAGNRDDHLANLGKTFGADFGAGIVGFRHHDGVLSLSLYRNCSLPEDHKQETYRRHLDRSLQLKSAVKAK